MKMASLPSGLGVAAERRGACNITSGVNFCFVLMVIMTDVFLWATRMSALSTAVHLMGF